MDKSRLFQSESVMSLHNKQASPHGIFWPPGITFSSNEKSVDVSKAENSSSEDTSEGESSQNNSSFKQIGDRTSSGFLFGRINLEESARQRMLEEHRRILKTSQQNSRSDSYYYFSKELYVPYSKKRPKVEPKSFLNLNTMRY